MALTKNFSYDHPAYTSVHAANLGTVGAGSGAVSQRFAAHTVLQLKAVNYDTVTNGTGAATDVKSLFISRAGTATTTQILGTTTAAAYQLNVVTTLTMGQGDFAWVAKGTDATEVGCATLEYTIVPGASVTP
jgi:hypothetical protein